MAGRDVDHPGDDEADAFAVSPSGVRGEHAVDSRLQLGDERLQVGPRLEGFERDGVAAEVRQHHERAAEPDVDGDDEPVVRPHVQHLRPASARGVDRIALVEGALRDELCGEVGDHAATDLHPARELRPGDRLVLADEIEQDLEVDLARSPASGADEAAGVDLPHRGARGDIAFAQWCAYNQPPSLFFARTFARTGAPHKSSIGSEGRAFDSD